MAKQIAPENVVGRDKLIAQMWKAIERSSAVFTAERRIGKTTVLKKMEAEPVGGRVVLYADLEKVDTPTRYVETLLADLKKHLTKKAIVGQWLGKFIESVGGAELGGVIKIPPEKKKDWQSILEKVLTDACSNQSDLQLVFLWDEIPYMLQKISALGYYNGQLMDADGKAVETASVAKALLNNIAIAAEPQSIDQCNADLKARMRFENRDAVIEVLSSLAKDHYVTRDEDGRYRFRFPLIQKWWILAEGLNR